MSAQCHTKHYVGIVKQGADPTLIYTVGTVRPLCRILLVTEGCAFKLASYGADSCASSLGHGWKALCRDSFKAHLNDMSAGLIVIS